jgi:hypothetical protein
MPHLRLAVRAGLVFLATLVCACGTVEGDLTDAMVGIDASPSDPDAAAPDAEVDATPVDCEPSSTVCTDGVLVRCDANGQGEPETCSLGCHASEARCNDLAPSNGLAEVLDAEPQNGDLVLGDNTTIDTTSGAVAVAGRRVDVITGERAATGNGVALRIIRVRSLTIGSAVVSGASGLVVVADGPIEIRGTIDISGAAGGAGAIRAIGVACAGRGLTAAPNVDGVYLQAGGGGAGFASAGAAGGDARVPGTTSAGGAGGAVAGDGALSAFRGGCPGGAAVFIGDEASVAGGVGGGALHLVSRTAIRLTATGATPGFIDAGGQGGKSAVTETRFGNAGSGGGSGGAILLEAPEVTLVSNTGLTANGGGGGCGLAGAGGAGQNGLRTTAAAAGAVCSVATAGRASGGAGASAAVPVAADGVDGENGGGGGGGGLGRIAVKNATMVFTPPDGSTLSPNPVVGQVGVR